MKRLYQLIDKIQLSTTNNTDTKFANECLPTNQ